VFTSRERKPMNRMHFNRYVRKPGLEAAGVDPARAKGMHALRRYFASVLLDAGESIRAVVDYLGHSDPAFPLRVYTRLMPTSENRARRAVDIALGSSCVTAVLRAPHEAMSMQAAPHRLRECPVEWWDLRASRPHPSYRPGSSRALRRSEGLVWRVHPRWGPFWPGSRCFIPRVSIPRRGSVRPTR